MEGQRRQASRLKGGHCTLSSLCKDSKRNKTGTGCKPRTFCGASHRDIREVQRAAESSWGERSGEGWHQAPLGAESTLLTDVTAMTEALGKL